MFKHNYEISLIVTINTDYLPQNCIPPEELLLDNFFVSSIISFIASNDLKLGMYFYPDNFAKGVGKSMDDLCT